MADFIVFNIQTCFKSFSKYAASSYFICYNSTFHFTLFTAKAYSKHEKKKKKKKLKKPILRPV